MDRGRPERHGSGQSAPRVGRHCLPWFHAGSEQLFEMASSEDHDAVEALGSHRADSPLGIRVRQSRQLHLMETVRPEPSG